MPKPIAGETKDAFISRCMGDAEAVSDFPDDTQRFAVCQSFWSQRNNEDIQVNNGDQVRVNVKSRVNSASIRKEKRNGRDVVVVPSATMPDDIVMNGIKYPAKEIEDSFWTLNQSPAPLGHPKLANGDFISARDGEGLNGYYFGAYNDNARRENGRVFLDKIIDVEMASKLPEGQRVLEAIDNGDPIHTSTGLLCNLEEAGENEGCRWIANGIIFDHDAILLDEEGAAKPDQGVGMMVNKAKNKDGDDLMVINSEIGDMLDRQIDYHGTELMSALQRKKDASTWERVKSAVMEAIGIDTRETETNSNEVDMTEVTKDQFDELSAQVNTLVEAIGKLDVASVVNEAVEPLKTEIEALTNANKAEAEAKHKSLVERVVNQNLLDEEAAKATPIAALDALLANAKGNKAAGISGGMFANDGDEIKFEAPEE